MVGRNGYLSEQVVFLKSKTRLTCQEDKGCTTFFNCCHVCVGLQVVKRQLQKQINPELFWFGEYGILYSTVQTVHTPVALDERWLAVTRS